MCLIHPMQPANPLSRSLYPQRGNYVRIASLHRRSLKDQTSIDAYERMRKGELHGIVM